MNNMITQTAVNLPEITKVVDEFVAAASNKYPQLNGNPSFAYPCGYLQSMVANMIARMPADQREHYLDLLQGK